MTLETIGCVVAALIIYCIAGFAFWCLGGLFGWFADDRTDEISIAKVLFWPVTIAAYVVAMAICLLISLLRVIWRSLKGLVQFFRYNIWELIKYSV